MAASPTCIPDRLFSYALWLAEGRGLERPDGQQESLFAEKTASPLWPILPLTRELIQPL